MADTPTNVNPGVLSTNYGGSGIDGRSGQLAGGVVVNLGIGSLGAGLTNEVQDQFKAPFKYRILSVQSSNKSVTGTNTYDLYNSTDSVAVIAAQTLATGATGSVTAFSAAGRDVIDKGDILQLRATTQVTTGAVTNLSVFVVIAPLGDADNVLA